MPGVASYVISAINGILVANLGAVLGIGVSSGGLRQAFTAAR